jgi:hypothetical protein
MPIGRFAAPVALTRSAVGGSLDAVRAHLPEMTGDRDGARSSYRRAAHRTTSLPEQRHLQRSAARRKPDQAPPVVVRPSAR